MSTPHRVCAQWTLRLDCTCPYCEREVNLLGAPDFWDGRYGGIDEHLHKKGVEVTCPECGGSFEVDCEY